MALEGHRAPRLRGDRGKFDTLDEALATPASRVDAVLREGRLRTVNALREFTPDQRVQCRGRDLEAAASCAGPRRGST